MAKNSEERLVVAYQVLAILADAVGLYLHPDVQHALDYLSGARDDTPLPFPQTTPLVSDTRH